MIHHVIDPNFFDDIINMYGTNYDIYVVTNVIRNEYGMQKSNFEKLTIFGSLQPQGTKLSQKTSGNIVSEQYKFYCKSLYRIRIGDFIVYDSKLLHITNVFHYDEYGVRECDLEVTQLNEHQDLSEFIQFLTGDEQV